MKKIKEIFYPTKEEHLLKASPDNSIDKYSINIDHIIHGHPDKVPKQIKDYSKSLGPIECVIHYYAYGENMPPKYETIFFFNRGNVKVIDGISSGHYGAGPNSFIRTLKGIGFNKDDISDSIYTRDSEGKGKLIFKINEVTE